MILLYACRSTDCLLPLRPTWAGCKEAAAQSGISLSRWMAEAALDRLRNQLLGACLDAWEAEDGEFNDRELNDAVAASVDTEAASQHAS